MDLNKYMDCRDIDSKTFRYHTFQFLHILKKNGIYCRKYCTTDSNQFKNTLNPYGFLDDYTGKITPRRVGKPETILNYFSEDAKELSRILAMNPKMKYDMNPYFNINGKKTFKEILNDWKLFFSILGIRFIGGNFSVPTKDTSKVIGDYYSKINT